MKYSDDFNEGNNGLPVAYTAIAGFLFVLAVLAVVLFVNREPPRRQPTVSITDSKESDEEESSSEDSTEILGNLKAEDLNIWDLYPEETSEEASTEETQEASTEELDESKDGLHTLVVNEDGSEEWVELNPFLKENEYDYTGLVYQFPIMKYFEDGTKVSYMGVDVSKYNEFIDYNKLRKAGVEFVMIRLGTRGYGSGQLSVDEHFFDNIKGASDAGLKVGVYFYSQAITEAEAIEEAETVISNLEDYEITYPVAFHMELVSGDLARVEALTREEKTNVAKTFLETVKEAGYKPMLYGTKEWLINKLDLTKLTEYDTWLAQEKDVPDYPYRFGMWQYTKQGKIDGISGKANLNISFIDYSEK